MSGRNVPFVQQRSVSLLFILVDALAVLYVTVAVVGARRVVCVYL